MLVKALKLPRLARALDVTVEALQECISERLSSDQSLFTIQNSMRFVVLRYAFITGS